MRLFLCAAACAALCSSVFAQSAPKIEVFGGFSYLSYEAASVNLPSGSVTQTCTTTGTFTDCVTPAAPTVKFDPRMGLYGWNGSVTADLTPWFGFTTDFSGNYSNATRSTTTTITTIAAPSQCFIAPCSTTNTYQYVVSEPKIHTFLFGPQFSFPTGKVKTYARFLAGGMNKNVSGGESVTLGGLVINSPLTSTSTASNYFALAFGGGVDYPLRKKISWRTGADYLTSTGTGQNHVRVYSGLVWRFGS
jgi:hypothetical protein